MLPLDERLRLAISARAVDATMMSSLRAFTEASLSDNSGHYAAFVFPNDFDNVLLGLCRVPVETMKSFQDKFNVLDDPYISVHRALDDGIGQFEALPLVHGGQAMVKGAEMVLSKAGIGMNLIMDEGKSLVSDIAQMGSIIQGTGMLAGAGGLGVLMMLIKLVMTPSKNAQGGRHPAPLYFPHYSLGRG